MDFAWHHSKDPLSSTQVLNAKAPPGTSAKGGAYKLIDQQLFEISSDRHGDAV
jgi:hypothetical protein